MNTILSLVFTASVLSFLNKRLAYLLFFHIEHCRLQAEGFDKATVLISTGLNDVQNNDDRIVNISLYFFAKLDVKYLLISVLEMPSKAKNKTSICKII